MLKKINEKIALLGTKTFGTMWAFYIFFIWGLLGIAPFVPQRFQNVVLLVSSAWIQLWALPLIAVGNTVLNKNAEKRAKEDHETIKKEFTELKEMHSELKAMMSKIQEIDSEIDDMEGTCPHRRKSDLRSKNSSQSSSNIPTANT